MIILLNFELFQLKKHKWVAMNILNNEELDQHDKILLLEKHIYDDIS